MPEKPRRILEKSKTVRRRYQRSNKRLQFTASQIERIEREEERERRAAKLREKEKKLHEKKKRRAEKEAKAREERKRLGLPDPNAPKVSPSQPLLLNFFTAKKPPQPQIEQPESDTELSDEEESDNIVEANSEQDTDGKGWEDNRGPDGSRGGNGQQSNGESDGYCGLSDEGSLSEAETIVMDLEETLNENTVKDETERPCSPELVVSAFQPLGDSFEDETSRLLRELLPDELAIDECIEEEVTEVDSARDTQRAADMSTARPELETDRLSEHFHEDCISGRQKAHSDELRIGLTTHENTAAMTANFSEVPIDIYQDPEDVLAAISTQDLADDDDDDEFDDKENLHPNIRQGQQLQSRITPRRPKPYSRIQASTEREPLSILNTESSSQVDEPCKSPSIRPRRVTSPAVSRKAMDTTACLESMPGTPPRSAFFSDDEFGDLDLAPEELEALAAL